MQKKRQTKKRANRRSSFTKKNVDALERLRAALAISKLLSLYGIYAENHGFDNAIMEAGIHALNCEIEAVLKLLGEKKGAKFPSASPNGILKKIETERHERA